MSKKIKQKNNISRVFLIGVPVVTLLFSTSANDPFNVPKQIVLFFIGGMLLVPLLGFYKVLNYSKAEIHWQVTLLILSFLCFQLFSLVLNDNKFISFFGDTSRRNGFLTYIGFCIITLYAIFKLIGNNNLALLKMLNLTSIPLLIYSTFQVNGHDFVKWDNPYNSAVSTLGNPNFTSAFISLSFLGALGIIQSRQFNFWWKSIAVLVCLVSPIIILQSESRQGFYAIVIGIIFYINLRCFVNHHKFRIAIYATSLIGVVLSILGMLQIGILANYLYKPSVSVRGYYWRAAVEMFLSNPLSGVGLDQYGFSFRKFKEVDYVINYGSDITSTDAHNTFLQMFATGGFGVGITYLGIIALTYFLSIKMLKVSVDENQKNISLVLLSLFTAYNAQSLISISNLGLSIWGWCLIGALLANSRNTAQLNSNMNLNDRQKLQNYKQQFINPFLYFIILTPILIASIFMYRSEYDMFILRGIANPNFPSNREQVIRFANQITKNPFADPYLKLRSALYLGDMGLYKEGFEIVKQLKFNSRNNYEALWVLALFQVQLGQNEEAIKSRLEIAKLDPYNTKNYLNLIKMYEENKQYNEMGKIYRLILSVDPNSQDAKSAYELLVKR